MIRLLLLLVFLLPTDAYAVDLDAIRAAAEAGNVSAMTTLGGLYHRGVGVQQDDVEATKWFLMAMERCHAGAQTIMGMVFLQGGEDGKARYWLRRAATQGDHTAQRQLDLLKLKPSEE